MAIVTKLLVLSDFRCTIIDRRIKTVIGRGCVSFPSNLGEVVFPTDDGSDGFVLSFFLNQRFNFPW